MTFSSNHVDELISASLTGDLTDAERAEMETHLARCEKCRATLAAFKTERRILVALPPADPPRDLSARVRTGIDSGRLGAPWWRRPGSAVPLFASAGVFAAVVLAVVVLGKLPTGPVGQATESPSAAISSAPSSTAVSSTAPSVGPTAPPPSLDPGPQLDYLELSGASLQPLKLSFINDATGASIDLGEASGPPIAASLSPDGQWLAYITQKGESSANEVWVLHLTDGRTVPLGCSEAAPFTDRLVWSPDGSYLAFTLIAIDLGPSADCPADDGAPGTADPWIYDAANGERHRLTRSGNAYAASFTGGDPATLLVSFAAESPWTEAIPLGGDPTQPDRTEGVFLPLVSPDGNRAIFWNGTMAQGADGVWEFSRGGMPQLSGDFRSTGPTSPWVGTPLFTDLTPVGGEAFASGKFTWGPDSDQFAFWDGAWTGPPQSADGTYPGKGDVDVGSVSSLLSTASRVVLDLAEGDWVVDVAIGNSVMAITIGLPSAGIGDPPSAYVQYASLDPHTVGGGTLGDGVKGGVEPPTWTGPAVFGH